MKTLLPLIFLSFSTACFAVDPSPTWTKDRFTEFVRSEIDQIDAQYALKEAENAAVMRKLNDAINAGDETLMLAYQKAANQLEKEANDLAAKKLLFWMNADRYSVGRGWGHPEMFLPKNLLGKALGTWSLANQVYYFRETAAEYGIVVACAEVVEGRMPIAYQVAGRVLAGSLIISAGAAYEIGVVYEEMEEWKRKTSEILRGTVWEEKKARSQWGIKKAIEGLDAAISKVESQPAAVYFTESGTYSSYTRQAQDADSLRYQKALLQDLQADDTIKKVKVGDVNENDNVDFQDFLIISKNFGKQTVAGLDPWKQGDLNFDGRIDFADYLIYQAGLSGTEY